MDSTPKPRREDILRALGAVTLPDGGDLVSRDLVRALVIDEGAVRFVLEAETPEAARKLEPVRDQAEARWRRIAGGRAGQRGADGAWPGAQTPGAGRAARR
jgi:ATP-binding protein involved in chromosome partitioning